MICFHPFVVGEQWDDIQGQWTFQCIYAEDTTAPAPIPFWTYYMGQCTRPLEGWDFQIWPFYHVDVAGYTKKGTAVDTQWRSGFFADDVEAAINEYWRYLASNPPRTPEYVSGSVIHEDSANCYNLPQVNRKRYRKVERKRYNTNWTQYHLWERSCQTWADEVTRN